MLNGAARSHPQPILTSGPTAAFSDAILPQRNVAREIPVVVMLSWLLVFLGYEWARHKGQSVGPPRSAADLFNLISAVECMEIFVLFRLLAATPRERGVGASVAFATLGGLAPILFLASGKPILGAALIAALILARYGKPPALRAFAIAQLLFVLQYVAQGWPFLVFHNAIGALDAGVTRAGAMLLGLDVGGTGTFVARPSLKIIFDVMWGCATSTTLAMVMPGFFIAILGFRGRIVRRDFAWLGILTLATVFCNWARLLLIIRSREAHAFWHDGDGSQLFALVYALLIFCCAFLATRRSPADREAA